MIEKVLDLPVIVQGALGSFLFWLCFVVVQALFDGLSKLLGRFSRRTERENLLFEKAHLLQHVFPLDDVRGVRMHLASIHTGVYLLIKGAVFLAFGLIASSMIGWISAVAYVFAVYYFFRALKACHVEMISRGDSEEDRKKRLTEIEERMKQIDSEMKA